MIGWLACKRWWRGRRRSRKLITAGRVVTRFTIGF